MNCIIDKLLSEVENPARYTGGELNAIVKPFDETEVTFAFCFPDTYEVGMSHLGLKILYGVLNRLPWALCERAFMPWVDMLAKMKEAHVPLCSLENQRPLRDFDIAGFTLQYEMSYTNILEMLSLGGIPLLGQERGDSDTIVVAGGPCAYNPEPLSLFIDAFMIGDGEEVIVEVARVVRDCRKERLPRKDTLRRLAELEGVYVPSLYKDSYHEDGTLQSLTPAEDGVPTVIQKRFVSSFEDAYVPVDPPVPYMQPVFDRIMLEIMRGCTRGCRFCQAGMIYRPVRERSIDRLCALARESVDRTGYDEISLTSLSSSDYSQLEPLTARLTRELGSERVSLSLPSLRVDKFVQDTLIHTQEVKKSSLTFAVEAGSQRLRDVINKNVTELDLVTTLRNAFENGWSAVKLYFMIGLPTETADDLHGIASLARECIRTYYSVPKGQRAKGLRITCSAAVFVPKPFTPFQWCAQDKPDIAREKQHMVKDDFRSMPAASFHYHDSALSEMEACFALGDRRIGRVLLRAWQLGCILDGWTEQFQYEKWCEAFADCGLSIDFYAHRERALDEVLPWDHISCGVSKEFLRREYLKAMNAETTHDCREGCNGCGLNKLKGVCSLCE